MALQISITFEPLNISAVSSLMEGIANARARGVYKGRKPSIDDADIRDMKIQGIGVSTIAKELCIARASVYRVLKRKAFD